MPIRPLSPSPIRDARLRLILVVGLGLAIGVLTFLGQRHISGALNALVNSTSAWLVGPFVAGALMATRRGALLAGGAVCVLQVVGYYGAAEQNGYGAGNAITFWIVCAVAGGPVFGVAGHFWRTAAPSVRGLGGAVLASSFLAEGLWNYLHVLHYVTTAELWIAAGIALAVVLSRGRPAELRWLPPMLTLGLIGEMALTTFTGQQL